MKKGYLTGLVTLSAVLLMGCAADGASDASSDTTVETETSDSVVSDKEADEDVTITTANGANAKAEIPADDTVYMRQLYAAPHGEKSVAVVTVMMRGDTILSAEIDEFQYLAASDEWTGVVNSDKKFGENYNDGQLLISKQENDEAYSDLMKANRDATYTWSENIQAIQSAAIGSTIAEVEALIAELSGQSDDDSPEDVVSGATFVDTAGYLQAIVDAAAQAK